MTDARIGRQGQRRLRSRQLLGLVLGAAVLVAVAIAVSSGGSDPRSAATGGTIRGAAFSSALFAGIPQRGNALGRTTAPVRLVEFADLQCPYCDEYAVQALPTLVRDYVRTGEVQMRFENLSFIGPDSVRAGRAAAAAAEQNRLWNFVDLLYLNQGEENTGYVTPGYLHRLLVAVPGLDVRSALAASQAAAANAPLISANQLAAQDGVDATPTFLIGADSGPLQVFQPSALTPAPFETEINGLLKGTR